MADQNTTMILWVAAILAVAFIIDVQSTIPLAATVEPTTDGVGATASRFGDAALSWWHERGGFEKNLIIYTGLGMALALLLKGIFRG